MSALSDIRGGERGSVLVITAVFLPVALIFAAFVVDVGNWWVHKRHLQKTADAAALAGAGGFSLACTTNQTGTDSAIQGLANKYAGGSIPSAPPQSTTFNNPLRQTPAADMHGLINAANFYGQSTPNDTDIGSTSPCASKMVDVKMTETNLGSFFQSFNPFPSLNHINAQARVQLQRETIADGKRLLPFGLIDVRPAAASVTLINESTGAVLAGPTKVCKSTNQNGFQYWDNSSTPMALNTAATNIGVRVTIGNKTDTPGGCGLPTGSTFSFDKSSASLGVGFIHGYNASPGLVAGNPPVLGDVKITNGGGSGCVGSPAIWNNYFTGTQSTCQVGLQAQVFIPPNAALTQSDFTITANWTGGSQAMTFAGGVWTIPSNKLASIPAASPTGAGGSVPFTIDWKVKKNGLTIGGNDCSKGQGCSGSFNAGATVQRIFSADDTNAGPVHALTIFDNGTNTNSLAVCASGCPHSMVISFGLNGSLALSNPGDPPVNLFLKGFSDSSRDGGLDCGGSNLRGELANGCPTPYQINPTGTCPVTPTPTPAECVIAGGAGHGNETGQIKGGFGDRIKGLPCPNHWADYPWDDLSKYPDHNVSDPRLVGVFVVPFGAFDSNAQIPVLDFAYFYVTGYDGDSCNSDDVAAKANVVGHWVKFIDPTNLGGGGGSSCDFSSASPCVAVLTR